MIILVMLFDLIEGKGGLIVVHVVFDLCPVAVAPGPEGSDQEHLIHHIPLPSTDGTLERPSHQVLRGKLF